MRYLLLLALFPAFLSLQAQAYFEIKFPDDQTIYGCGASADTVWPTVTLYPGCGINVGISVHDQVYFTNNTGGCYKIIRRFRTLYWCDYDPAYVPFVILNPPGSDVGPTVFGTPDNHGYLEYNQVIKVVDNDDPVFLDCPASPDTFCDYSANSPIQYPNACEGSVDLHISVTDSCSGNDIILKYLLFLDLNGDGTMETFVSSSAPGAWPIETSVNGSTLTGQVKFAPGEQLPYGTHKIKWIADDHCGNEAVCEYLFVVKDCNPPTVVCLNGLSVNIMSTGMITLEDQDFVLQAYDNCTPTNQLEFGIIKAVLSTGDFPAGVHEVTFDCMELGQQEVQVWYRDASGNADFCQTYVIVQDNFGACGPSGPLKGTVQTEQLAPVPDVKITLKKSSQTLNATTDQNGSYQFDNLPAGCGFILTPSLSADAQSGINTLDALLAAAWISGDLPQGSPYKLLAADTDHSGQLDAADIQHILNVALSIDSDFPGAAPWQFVPAGFQFADPANPWNAPGQATLCLQESLPTDAGFVAMKTGDLDGSAPLNALQAHPEDRQADVVYFLAPDRSFQAGATVVVPLTSPDLDGLPAFQFTLGFDPAVLALQSVEPALVPAAQIGVFPDQHRVTAGWLEPALINTSLGKNSRNTVMTLVFTALQTGRLRDAIFINSDLAAAEAYTANLETLGAGLQFVQVKGGVILLPVQPNPAVDQFNARFFLPESGDYQLALRDLAGRPIDLKTASGAAGWNQVNVEIPGGIGNSMLLLHLEGPGGSAVQKVLVQR